LKAPSTHGNHTYATISVPKSYIFEKKIKKISRKKTKQKISKNSKKKFKEKNQKKISKNSKKNVQKYF
jgi:hypothetical protein